MVDPVASCIIAADTAVGHGNGHFDQISIAGNVVHLVGKVDGHNAVVNFVVGLPHTADTQLLQVALPCPNGLLGSHPLRHVIHLRTDDVADLAAVFGDGDGALIGVEHVAGQCGFFLPHILERSAVGHGIFGDLSGFVRSNQRPRLGQDRGFVQNVVGEGAVIDQSWIAAEAFFHSVKAGACNDDGHIFV